jgi:hypothetical protein
MDKLKQINIKCIVVDSIKINKQKRHDFKSRP